MGKTSRRKKGRDKKVESSSPQRTFPNWPLFGLSLIGIGIAGYLTFVNWTGQGAAGCPVESGCDAVLSSQWGKLLGLPTSFWGFITYLGLAVVAFIKKSYTHWRLAWALSMFSLLYSFYLTTISIMVIDATCPFCLTSLILVGVIFGVVTYQRPVELPAVSFRIWLLQAFVGSAVLVVAVHLIFYSGYGINKGTKENPKLQALAEHLTKTGAKFYGANWCDHCEEQKAIFEESAHRLPYIECSPGGRRTPQASICKIAGIRSYPTWFINDVRYERILSLKRLAWLSGY